jgi:hypothetical protein
MVQSVCIFQAFQSIFPLKEAMLKDRRYQLEIVKEWITLGT